jgi:hypothetical protein
MPKRFFRNVTRSLIPQQQAKEYRKGGSEKGQKEANGNQQTHTGARPDAFRCGIHAP